MPNTYTYLHRCTRQNISVAICDMFLCIAKVWTPGMHQLGYFEPRLIVLYNLTCQTGFV